MAKNPDYEKQKVAIDLWRGHVEFSWSQVRMIPVLQVAIAAGAWATIKDAPDVASAVLVLGSLVLGAVVLMLVRHFQYSEAFKKAAGDFFPEVGKPKIIRSDITIIALAGILAASNAAFAFFTEPVSEMLKAKETTHGETKEPEQGKCSTKKRKGGSRLAPLASGCRTIPTDNRA